MKILIKLLKLFIQNNFNFLYRYYIKKVVKKKFKKEIDFFENKNFNTVDKESILFFTSHKSASTFFDKFFYLIRNSQKRICINVDQYNTFILENKFNHSESFLGKFKSRGYIFGPIRTYLKIPNLQNYKIVLFLRDPRDVLVSDYFSTKFSHNSINQELILEKKKVQNKTIDEFVLWKSGYYKKKYESYLPLLELKNVKYIRYNDFIENPNEIKDKLLEIFEVNKLTEELKNFFDEKKTKSKDHGKINIYDHQKMGQLNIFQNHLKQDSISCLNEEYKDILVKFKF